MAPLVNGNAVNAASTTRAVEIDLNGANASGTPKVTTLESADLNAENSFDHPKNVAPKDSNERNRFTAAHSHLLECMKCLV